MIHPKSVRYMLLAFVTLLFVSCTKVSEEVVATVIEAPILTFENVDAGTNIKSGDVVSFEITLRNEGGFDSTGLYVYAKLNNVQVGFKKSTPVNADSTVVVTIPWTAIAGSHSFIFSVEKAVGDTSKFAETIEFPVTVSVKKQVQKEVIVVDAAEKEVIIDDIFGADEEVDDVFDKVDEKLSTVTDQNEAAILKTVSIVAKKDLKVSKTVTPTKVIFEDTTISTVILPLSKTVIDPVTQVENEILDTTTFFVALNVAEEVVTEAAIFDGAEVVTKKESKKTTVPVVVDITESVDGSALKFESIEIKNGLGGIKLDVATGSVSLLAVNRETGKSFWESIHIELGSAYPAVLLVLRNPNVSHAEIKMAVVDLFTEFSSIVKAYGLQKEVSNDLPVIIVEPSTGTFEYRVGNDLIMNFWDVYTASVHDDRIGAKLTTASVFNPGVAGATTMLPQSFTFTAIDVDGAATSKTVTSKYKKVIVKDVFIHDQGESGN